MKKIITLLITVFLFSACSSGPKEGEKYPEDDLQSLAYVFTQEIVKEKTGKDIKDDYDNYKLSTQKYNDDYNTYIITYSDSENKRIKYIFEWDEKKHKDGFKKDDWYLLVNGNVIFDELDAKREEAIKNAK